ncbi:MAG: hypothetical protein AAFV43_10435 [Planctomycetota bacterium]
MPAAPPAPSAAPPASDNARVVEQRVRQASRDVLAGDIATALAKLLLGALVFLAVAALLEHWVTPSGLRRAERWGLWTIGLVGLVAYAVRRLGPLVVRRVNPLYAASQIEREAPTLKNSVLNLLQLREAPAAVRATLERQAAQRLAAAGDTPLDRAELVRLGYVLLAILLALGVYTIASPKNLFVSAARIVAPWSDLAAPTRVSIDDLTPGNLEVSQGETVEITARVLGLETDEPVELVYTTGDGRLRDERLTMRAGESGVRFSARLPAGSSAEALLGLQSDVTYRLEAGDARTEAFELRVAAAPTIAPVAIQYDYPAYTGYLDTTIDGGGDIRAIEGTRVTVRAEANLPIDAAQIDRGADGTPDVRMQVDGPTATGGWTLKRSSDAMRETSSYVLRFSAIDGQANADPPVYRVETIADLRPEVRLIAPESPRLTVGMDAPVEFRVSARDPDFALSKLRLLGDVGGRSRVWEDLLEANSEGPVERTLVRTPRELGLRPGDVLDYRFVAADNRTPQANVVESPTKQLVVADEDPRPEGGQPDPGADGRPDDAGQQQQGDNESPANDRGDGESDQGDAGGKPNAPSGQPEPGQRQPEPSQSGAGEQSEPQTTRPSENDEEEPSEEGGDSQGQPGGMQGPGGNGEDGENEQPGGAGQSSDQSSDGSQNGPPSQGGSQGSQGGDSQAEPGQQRPDGSSGSRSNDRGGDNAGGPSELGEDESGGGEPGGGEPGDGAGSESPVARDGGDDAEAFERIREHLDQQQASEGSDNGGDGQPRDGQPSDDPSGADPGAGDRQEGGRPDNQPGGADQGMNPRDGTPESPERDGGAAADGEGRRGERSDSATSDRGGDTTSGRPTDPSAGPREGTGEAGENQAADRGTGQSADRGAGETSGQPGRQQTADGKTGESSGDTPGEGSASRDGNDATGDGAGDSAGDANSEAAGDSANQRPAGEGQADRKGPPEREGQPAREGQPGKPTDGSNQRGDGEPGDSSRNGEQGAADGQRGDGQPTGQSTGDRPAGEAQRGEWQERTETGDPSDSQQPSSEQAGGSENNGRPQRDATGSDAEDGDEANLDYARQQTELTLDKLADQLANGEADRELLDKLGWSEQDLRRFVDRWRGRQRRAARSQDGAAELDSALRSLGLRPDGPTAGPAARDDTLRDLREGVRTPAPPALRERLRYYNRGVGAATGSDD